MAHWRTMQDNTNRYVAAFDLQQKDITVTISDVKSESVEGQKGDKKRKVIIYFDGKDKPFLANTTNCKTIATMYGVDADKWKGKRITIYPTVVQAFGEQVEAIRVPPRVAE